MNFIHVVILTVIICAIQNVYGDDWNWSRKAYIKVLNTFLQNHYNAGKASRQNIDENKVKEWTGIDENFQGSMEETQAKAEEILENNRRNFTVTKASSTNMENIIIKGNSDYAQLVRSAVHVYCEDVRSNRAISRGCKIIITHISGYHNHS